MPTDARLAEIEARLHSDHLVDGVMFVRWGDRYDTGADNALFTGFTLAQASFAYATDPTLERLERVHTLLRGIELLTTVTGTPGVLVRLAFPLADAWTKIGYDYIKSLMFKGNTWGQRKREGGIYETPTGTHFYYTRTTRDQLVGVVFGLAVAWRAVTDTKTTHPEDDEPVELDAWLTIAHTIRALTARLESTRYSLRDHTGRTHGTSAHRVLKPLRHTLRLLDHEVNGTPLKGSLRWFYRWNWLHTFYYRWTRSTFAFNLRMTTGLTLWLLGEKDARRWVERAFGFVRHHGNAWFGIIAGTVGIQLDDMESLAVRHNLKGAALRNYGGNFRWQKPPGDWDGAPDRIGPGVDVLLPEWLRRWSEKREA